MTNNNDNKKNQQHEDEYARISDKLAEEFERLGIDAAIDFEPSFGERVGAFVGGFIVFLIGLLVVSATILSLVFVWSVILSL